MKKVSFADTGEYVSEMCLGTMMFGSRCDEAESERILSAALERGVTFVDTAAMYAEGHTEEVLGRIIKGKRDKLFIATKVHKGTDARSIDSSLDESLSRLQTDYVDLYLIHWPVVGMNALEVMRGLNEVVVRGKARYVGCSNFPAWLIAHCNGIALKNGWARLVNNQVAYNLFERGIEVEILPQAIVEDIAVTTYRPLAMGLLTGKYRAGQPIPSDSRGQTEACVITWLSQYAESIERFIEYAVGLGVSPAQLAIAWVRYSAGVTSPIVGISSVQQLETTIAAFDLNLSPPQYDQVTSIFETAVKEEGLQLFPDRKRNFPRLRRSLELAQLAHSHQGT